MMRKTLLIQFILVFFISPSFSQLRMKNRSAWKSSSRPDSAAIVTHQTTEVPDTSAAKQLSEVIVSATRTPKKLDDIGRSVSLISKEDIKNSGANSVAEVLSQYEGIYITGTQQTFGANQSMFMRGSNSNQSVVMIDGVPVSDPSTPNAAIDLSELSLSDIDRIEIVRGSHSTQYGSSAIGGVVNIITSGKQKEGMNINTSGTAGSFGKETSLMSEKIGLNYTCKDGFYASMNLLNMNVNGINGAIDTTANANVSKNNKSMDRFDYGGKVGFQNNRWDMHVGYKKVTTNANIDKGAFQPDNARTLDFTRDMVSYGATWKYDSTFSVSFNGGYSSMTRKDIDDSSAYSLHQYSKGVYTGKTYTDELQFQFKEKGYSFIFGGSNSEQFMSSQNYSYYYGSISSSNLDSLNLASRTNSMFLLLDLNGELVSEKAKAFSLVLGGRMIKNNTFNTGYTYQVNPMVKVSATTTLYANFSSGYNAPSLYELHAPDKDPTSQITMGNINLRPEISETNEFGVYQKISDKTGVRIGYFSTLTSDVIEFVNLWDKNIAVSDLGTNPIRNDFRGDTYMNLGRLLTRGIELDVHGAISKQLLLAGNFSYLKGTQMGSYEAIDTVKSKGNHVQMMNGGGFVDVADVNVKGLARRPIMANISLTYYPAKKIFCKAILKYVSKRNDVFYDYSLGPYGALGTTSVAAYTLVDFIGGVKFDANTSALVRVENIFDVSYSEIIGYAARGRGIYFTINYTF